MPVEMPSAPDPKRQFALQVVERLQQAGFQALWAGGCVRDLLLQRVAQDFDVATSARPNDVINLFGRRRTQTVGASFGVILVLGPRAAGPVEVATFRSDGEYLDGRRPEQVTFTSAEQDAHRRDFTINGMFYDPLTEQVADYVDGQTDLTAKLVRAIGSPADRMREDKLRMLRAVRFAATLEFDLDPATAAAISDMASELREVSAERISQELHKMLINSQRARALQLCHDLGLLDMILPDVFLDPDPGVRRSWQTAHDMLAHLLEPTFEVCMACLLHALEPSRPGASQSPVVNICRRLRFSNQQTTHIDWLVANQQPILSARQLTQPQLFRLLAQPLISPLLQLVTARCRAYQESDQSVLFCREVLQNTSPGTLNPAALISGDDLIGIGLRPGRQFQGILDAVRDAQLDGQVSTAEEAVCLARKLHDHPTGQSSHDASDSNT